MTTNYHLTPISGNTKTGPMPVSITSNDTCPSACPLKGNGCYAENSYMGIHWKKVSSGNLGTNLKDFCDKIAKLPRNVVWRHNSAGDLPGAGNKINAKALNLIVQANKKARAKGFTFTHKPVLGNSRIANSNAAIIKEANDNGFTINLSANNLEHADSLRNRSIGPVVAIVDTNAPRFGKTPQGAHYAVCPAQEREDITCSNCRLCSLPNRKIIIAFRAHGPRKNTALKVIQNNYN